MVDLWRDFWIRETGTGKQVAQLHDRYMMMMMMMMIYGDLYLTSRQFDQRIGPQPHGRGYTYQKILQECVWVCRVHVYWWKVTQCLCEVFPTGTSSSQNCSNGRSWQAVIRTKLHGTCIRFFFGCEYTQPLCALCYEQLSSDCVK